SDVHERDRLVLDRIEQRRPFTQHRCGLRRRIAKANAVFHIWISLVTGFDSWRNLPPVQPAQIAENKPAWPPACTIRRPSGQNLLIISPARRLSTPSPTP